MNNLYEEILGHISYMMRDEHMGIELNWNGFRKAKLRRDELKIKIEVKKDETFYKKEFDLAENIKASGLTGTNKTIVETNLKEMFGL